MSKKQGQNRDGKRREGASQISNSRVQRKKEERQARLADIGPPQKSRRGNYGANSPQQASD